MIDRPPPGQAGPGLTRSTLLPLFSRRSRVFQRTYLVPMVIVAVAALLLYELKGAHGPFQLVLALALTTLECAVIYLLCGRRHLWVGMVAVFVVTAILMLFTQLFDVIHDWFQFGATRGLADGGNAGVRFVGQFVSVALVEELFKALPLLALMAIGLLGRSRALPGWCSRIALNEPLDGIALGVASGAAFAVVETLFQYVPEMVAQAHGDTQTGLELMIFRAIAQSGGHLAYSGVFGYFLGLAVLRPPAAPLLVLFGYAIAASFHAAWNAVGSMAADMLVALLAAAFLIACILKARQLSPTRSRNFATAAIPAAAFRSAAAPAPAPAAAGMEPAGRPARPAALVLRIGPATRRLSPGQQIEPRHLGAAGAGRGRGPIAAVVAGDAGTLKLRNLAARSWRVRLPDGRQVEAAEGSSLRLAAGLVIDFGGVEGRVMEEAGR
jgi:RsiW-degrading membrane proteinase PrsW (M82 family)